MRESGRRTVPCPGPGIKLIRMSITRRRMQNVEKNAQKIRSRYEQKSAQHMQGEKKSEDRTNSKRREERQLPLLFYDPAIALLTASKMATPMVAISWRVLLPWGLAMVSPPFPSSTPVRIPAWMAFWM